MKAIYRFEEELIKKYDFEPANDGYDIDDLNEKDREHLSGMLFALYGLEDFRYNETQENEYDGIIGKIHNEYFESMYERMVEYLIANIQDFTISCIDNSETEGE